MIMWLPSRSDSGGGFGVDEDRFERMTRADTPDGISSSGFAILALIFHPNMRQDFDMKCEGLGRWQGRATWLVHFEQRRDRAPRMVDFKLNGNTLSGPSERARLDRGGHV
jgi:hypothetical protein